MRIRKGHSITGIAYRENLFRVEGRCPRAASFCSLGRSLAPNRLEILEGIGEEDSWLW